MEVDEWTSVNTEEDTVSCPILTCSSSDPFAFLHGGYISRILSQQEEKRLKNGSSRLSFFGRSFSELSLYISNDSEKFFMLLKQSIFGLMNLAFKPNRNEDVAIQESRKEISCALYFCNVIISRWKFAEASKELEDLLSNLQSCYQSIGPISELTIMHSYRKILSDATLNALFHLRLEVTVHYIMAIMQCIFKHSDVDIYQKKFVEVSSEVVSDLILLSNHLYERNCVNQMSLWSEEFFLCSCLKEVWIILIHTVDSISKMLSLPSFWSLLSSILQQQDTTSGSQVPESMDTSIQLSQYSPEFKLWLLTNIAPLYWIDVSGRDTFNEKSSVPRNWQLVQELTQKMLSSSDVKDSTVKSILWGCLCLTKHWDAHLNIFSVIWNYISKHLDTVSNHNSGSLKAYVKKGHCLNKKNDFCLTFTKSLTSMPEDGTTFELFLSYLVALVTRLEAKGDSQTLSQLKLKLYSKFHKHSMNLMGGVALEKFSTLFTVLGLICATHDIPNKMCSLISLLQFKEKSTEVRKLFVESLFISLMLCKHHILTADGIVGKIVGVLTSIVILLKETRGKKELYVQNWDLLSYYLDCVEKCFDYNALIPDEGALICNAYSYLLKFLSDNQRKKIYGHFRNILSSSYVILQSNAYDLVRKNIYHPLSEMAIVENNVVNMAELLGAITILSLEKLPSDSEFVALITKYGFSDEYSVAFKCLYMSHILSTSSAVEKMIELEKSNDLLKLWINSAVQGLHKSPGVLELTRSLLSSWQILNWQPTKECYLVEDVEVILIQYIIHLGNTYSSMPTWNEMVDFRKFINFLFSDYVRISENVILNSSCQKSLTFVFVVAGQLVASCSKAIYSKTAQCLLPDVLDLFVLPISSAKKPISADVCKNVKLHLHVFLSGIVSLFSKSDSFLTRKVREVMHKYFMEFVLKSSQEGKRNPFLISLDGSCVDNPIKAASEYRQLVLECIRDRFLNLPQPPEQLVGVLKFLSELIQNTRSEAEHFHTMKLISMKVVSCILVCDAVGGKGEPRQVRKYSMEIMRRIAAHIKNSKDSSETFRALLHKFVLDNLGNYPGVILKTMQCVCVVSPSVMKTLLPDIENLISEQEKRRGVGIDGALRESLGQLQSLVSGMTSHI